MKGNLGSGDHAFAEEDKNYTPESLEEKDDRRMPGELQTNRKIWRDSDLGGQMFRPG
ncbi:MAG: hypothetical protein WCH75_29850 [Candidatus Binatia bacterium]